MRLQISQTSMPMLVLITSWQRRGIAVQVRAVKLRRDRIAVALDHRVLIYNFADLRLIYQWETIHNGSGLLAVSSQVDNTVVACPGVHVGQVSLPLPHGR